MATPADNRLLTPWGEKLDKNNVLPEYPRPQFVRDSYITYNQRTNIPQNCVTLMNQVTGEITTQCSQNGSQIIMVNP